MLESSDPKQKPTATDPMDRYVLCNCGKPECWTNDLRPLRHHMKALMQAISSCGHEDLIDGGHEAWPGALYALHMAVSIEDVFVDPSYVDESKSGLYCDIAWDFDEVQREEASRYVAALTIFNFTWTAYEAAIEHALGPDFSKDKLPVQARKFFASSDKKFEDDLITFERSYRVARQICRRIHDIREPIGMMEEKYHLKGAAAAAELARIFRNHIFHGKDSTPLSGERAMVSHFYAMTRLLLMLVQLLLVYHVRNVQSNIPFSFIFEDKGALPARHVLLNLHRPEPRWAA